MKIRILFAVAFTALFFWSCDEPIAYDNPTFSYNPFSFHEDTLYAVQSIQSGSSDLNWGSHFRAWVGETQYYKAGFVMEFVFADTGLDITGVDSIQVQLKHQKTYPELGGDTLGSSMSTYGLYETMNQPIDIENSVYGNPLGIDSVDISGDDNFWNFTIPADLISQGDTIISLGVFPEGSDYLSAVYGGGSVSRPSLNFLYHEADTAGLDSVTSVSFLADTVFMHLTENNTAFDRSQFDYVSQLKSDSVEFSVDIESFTVAGDTLQHIISSSFLPEIDEAFSALYKPDTTFLFSMVLTDPVSEISVELSLGDGEYISNEIKNIIQSAIDEQRTELDLILKPLVPGYNPGFIAISKDITQTALSLSSSRAVQP